MSVKKSQLETKIVPIIQGILDNVQGTIIPNIDHFVGMTTTQILINMYGCEIGPKKHFRTLVTSLSEESATILKNELKHKTFSFDIMMSECEKFVCYEKWFNGPKEPNSGRPCLPIFRGKSPGFCVFIHKNEILAAINMYHSNFNQWADKIGLAKTMYRRTSMPSTHFVYTKSALESGLLWINPKLEWI